MSDSEDPVDIPDVPDVDEEEGDADDLFGDGFGSEAGSEKPNVLSDRDLESDGDEERQQQDRRRRHSRSQSVRSDVSGRQVRNMVIMGQPLYRHRAPKPKDGMLRSIRVPPFLKWEAEEYNPDSLSEWDLSNAKNPNPKHVIRHRKDPATGKVQSNANVHRWSDGSVTISIGDEHYALQAKQMAPLPGKPYKEVQDSHYYAATAQLGSNALMVVGHVGEQYTVRPNKGIEDDAVQKFMERMAAATRKSHAPEGELIINSNLDPELQKKEAEMAEKERSKMQRKRETAAARLDASSGKFGRTGLSLGDLERRPAGGRKRGAPGGSKPKKRRPEYDSDDDLPQGAHRQEDYDMEDDFIARSDEDISQEEDEEEEDILDDDDEEEAPRSKRQKTADAEDDADADGDMDDEDAPAHAHDASGRRARRHIIDDDDEED